MKFWRDEKGGTLTIVSGRALRARPGARFSSVGVRPMTAEEVLALIRKEGEKAIRKGVPRVSTALYPGSLPGNASPNPKTGDRHLSGARLGTRVHGIIEDMIRGNRTTLPPDAEPPTVGYALCAAAVWGAWRSLHPEHAVAVEIPVGCRKWPLRGTADFIGVRVRKVKDTLRTDVSLLDWKTGGKGRVSTANRLQMAGYREIVVRTLRRAGVESLTMSAAVVVLSPLAGLPVIESVHRADVDEIRRRVDTWRTLYADNKAYRKAFDATTEAEIKATEGRHDDDRPNRRSHPMDRGEPRCSCERRDDRGRSSGSSAGQGKNPCSRCSHRRRRLRGCPLSCALPQPQTVRDIDDLAQDHGMATGDALTGVARRLPTDTTTGRSGRRSKLP